MVMIQSNRRNKTRILDMGLKFSTPLMPENLATLWQEEEKMLEWV